MGDVTKVDGRTRGQLKQAAARTGVSVEEWENRRANGLHWCFRCRSWKEVSTFSKDINRSAGVSSQCKPCQSDASTASRYGLKFKIFRAIKLASDSCPICGRAEKLVVDHNHKTGAVRSLICTRCNVGLGQFGDDPNLLRKAAEYLEATHG